MELNNKVVAITGAARGIGRAIAEAFAARGARIALLDLQSDELERTCSELAGAGAEIRAYQVNVTSEDQVAAALDQLVADFGRLDVMVNNAGIVKDGLLIKAKEGQVTGKMSLAQWQAVIDVNLTGVFLCGREAAERMIRLGQGGVIINISSISRAGNIGQSNYAAAKAGVAALSTTWARELARFNIRSAAIAPGVFETEMVASLKPEAHARITGAVPLQRTGAVEELAHAVCFIVENDYYSGRILELDGGLRL